MARGTRHLVINIFMMTMVMNMVMVMMIVNSRFHPDSLTVMVFTIMLVIMIVNSLLPSLGRSHRF